MYERRPLARATTRRGKNHRIPVLICVQGITDARVAQSHAKSKKVASVLTGTSHTTTAPSCRIYNMICTTERGAREDGWVQTCTTRHPRWQQYYTGCMLARKRAKSRSIHRYTTTRTFLMHAARTCLDNQMPAANFNCSTTDLPLCRLNQRRSRRQMHADHQKQFILTSKHPTNATRNE